MPSIELGITKAEFIAMLPDIISDLWEHYSDDDKISVDEGVAFIGTILAEMADAADEEVAKVYLASQAQAMVDLAALIIAFDAPE